MGGTSERLGDLRGHLGGERDGATAQNPEPSTAYGVSGSSITSRVAVITGDHGIRVCRRYRDYLVRADDELRERRGPALRAAASASITPGWSLPRFANRYLTPASARASRNAVLVV